MVLILFQFGNEEGIPSLNGQRVAFDDNGDLLDPGHTIWNYNSRAGSYQFQEVCRQLFTGKQTNYV